MIWAVSLLTTELSPRSLTAYPINTVFGVWLENLEKLQGILFSALPPYSDDRRQPQSCFGKNQLLPNSISFSLLTTSHPRGLHASLVRSSPQLSSGFNLLAVSSSGFGSWTSNIIFRAFNTRFRYASTPKGLRLLAIQTRWLVLQKARRHSHITLRAMWNLQFSILNFQSIYNFSISQTFRLSHDNLTSLLVYDIINIVHLFRTKRPWQAELQ